MCELVRKFQRSLRLSLRCALVFAASSLPTFGSVPAGRSLLVYVGTYTDWELFGPPRRNPPGERSQGIYVFRFDAQNGELTSAGLAAATDNPTYVTFAPSGKVLYAVNEVYRLNGEATGGVSAFSIDAGTGRLSFLNQVSARGTGTCHAVVDATGRHLLAANFGSGSVAVFPLEPDGRLRAASDFAQDTGAGPHVRQATPHAHAFNLTPDNRFAVASQFGTDRLLVYRFDPVAGTIVPAQPPEVKLKPGSAPRHLAFHPDGKFSYSLNEIDSTITVLRYEAARGALTVLGTHSSLPAGFSDRNTAAEIVVHPTGKFLYVSNRGHHSIGVFAIDQTGGLELQGHVPTGGRTPRGFSVDPTGRWLIAANQDTHELRVFSLHPGTGMPEPTEHTASVRTPVCVKFFTLP